jgi:transglutaminase-like putative cysteine protease
MINRFRAWIHSIFNRIWIPIALSATTILTLSITFNESRWTRGSHLSIALMIFSGCLLGILLALTQFHGWFAVIMSLFLSAAGVIQSSTGLIQPVSLIEEISFPVYLNLTHLRSIAFLGQFTEWINTLFETGDLTHQFTALLTGFAVWNLCAWMAWWTLHRHQSLTGMLPMNMFIALHVQQHRENTNIVLFFFALILLTSAYVEFRKRKHNWEVQNIDYPLDFGFDWPASAIGFAVLLVFWGSFAQIIGTTEGHQKISDFFAPEEEIPLAETQIPLVDNSQNVFTAELAIDFSPPPSTEYTVMWVSVSDPPPPQSEMISDAEFERYYWRSEIFTIYTGYNWQAADTTPLTEEISIGAPFPGRRQINQSYEIVISHGDKLFAINQPINTEPPELLQALAVDGSPIPAGDTSAYLVTSWIVDLDSTKLRDIDYQTTPQLIYDTYLQLPEEFPQRITDLAKGLTAQSETRFEKTMRIQDYLRRTYLYDLRTPPPPADQDVVDYFLFDAQSGFCSHYASAMVVMLRSVGVPARLVTGYAHGDYFASRNAYRVPSSAAHAWVEVFFPTYGWVEFEPTPNRSAHRYEKLTEWDTDDDPERIVFKNTRNNRFLWISLVIIGIFLSGISVSRIFHIRARKDETSPVHKYYWGLRHRLVQVGIDAEPGTTPNEFLHVASPQLENSESILPALKQLTQLYNQDKFNPRPLDAGQIHRARQIYRNVFPEWRKMMLKQIFSNKASSEK